MCFGLGVLNVLAWTTSMTGDRKCSHAEFDGFRSMFDQVRRLAQTMPPAALIPVLIAQTHGLRLMAAGESPTARKLLWPLAGRYAEFAGWMAQETGDDTGAFSWTAQAVELAARG